MIATSAGTLHGTCGVGVFYAFSLQRDKPYRNLWGDLITPNKSEKIGNKRNPGGAGWLTAGFINTSVCKEAYEALASKYKIVFQSPKRTNTNSGHAFIFIVYDTKMKPDRPRWVGKGKGAPKPQALIDWENAPANALDNSSFKWPF